LKITIDGSKKDLSDTKKRVAVAKAIVGRDYNIIKKSKKVDTVYAKEKPVKEPRSFRIKAANEMFEHWDVKFKKMIENIKKDISVVLDEVE